MPSTPSLAFRSSTISSALRFESDKIPLLKTVRELGVAVVAYSPLGHGMLSGTIKSPKDFSKPGDLRGLAPQLEGDNFAANAAIAAKIADMAKGKGATASQLVLAWLLAQGDDVFPIPGTNNASRLKENLGSMSVSITAEEEEVLRELGKGVSGGRVQDVMGYSFADTAPL